MRSYRNVKEIEMTARKPTITGIIGGVLFIVYSILRTVLVNDISALSIQTWLYILSFVIIGIGLLTGLNIISVIGTGLTAVVILIWAISDIMNGWGTWQGRLSDISIGVAAVLLMILLLTHMSGSPGSFGQSLDKMWFLPGLVFVIGYLPILFANIDFYFSADGAKFILNILIQWSATFLAGHGVCNRAAVAAAPAAMGTPYAPAYMPQQQAMPPYGVSPVQMPQHPSSSMPQQAPVRMPQQIAPAAQTQSGQIDAGVFEILRKYKTLLDEGVLTQEEFEAKKRSLLG